MNSKNALFIAASAAILLLFIIVQLMSVTRTTEVTRESVVMGTVLKITAAGDEETVNSAIDAAYAEIERLNAEYSVYNPESLVSRVNAAGTEGCTVTEEFITLLNDAERMWKLTDGRFDVTVGPLMKLWGFERKQGRVPSNAEIDSVLKRVGFAGVEVSGRRVRMKTQGMAIDFGATVKGYAVDRVASILRSAGIENFMIDLGGNIYAAGRNPRGEAWKIGIRDPRMKDEIIGVLSLSDMATATSGDYERMFEMNGKRYSHIVDPKTGRPLENIAAVTVVAHSAYVADLFSTSCYLAGPSRMLHENPEVVGAIYGVIDDAESSTIRWHISSGIDVVDWKRERHSI